MPQSVRRVRPQSAWLTCHQCGYSSCGLAAARSVSLSLRCRLGAQLVSAPTSHAHSCVDAPSSLRSSSLPQPFARISNFFLLSTCRSFCPYPTLAPLSPFSSLPSTTATTPFPFHSPPHLTSPAVLPVPALSSSSYTPHHYYHHHGLSTARPVVAAVQHREFATTTGARLRVLRWAAAVSFTTTTTTTTTTTALPMDYSAKDFDGGGVAAPSSLANAYASISLSVPQPMQRMDVDADWVADVAAGQFYAETHPTGVLGETAASASALDSHCRQHQVQPRLRRGRGQREGGVQAVLTSLDTTVATVGLD